MMTEKEKMIAGDFYSPTDAELTKDRAAVRALVYRFNNLGPADDGSREALLQQILGSSTTPAYIEPPFRCDYGYNIHVGANFYANFNLVVLDVAPVTIGDNVMIAPNVGIYTATHPVHHVPRNSGREFAKPIHIGHNVWIGGHTVINPGVTIGDNSVIGSGSVVTKNIPPNVIAAGNPCRVLREITDADKQAFQYL